MNDNTPQYATAPPNSTMAIISLIAGITGFFVFPVIGSIVAIITGHMAKKEIDESNGTIGGEGMAKIGLILGYIGVGLSLLGICCFVLIFFAPFLAIPFSQSSLLPALTVLF